MVQIHLQDPSLFIRSCFEDEYAFEIHYPEHTVRVAHNKGVWFLAKNEEIFEYTDDAGVRDASPFITGIILGFESQAPKDLNEWRRRPAWVLEHFLHIWGGIPTSIVSIDVKQQGRNSYLSSEGMIKLAPRTEEWAK